MRGNAEYMNLSYILLELSLFVMPWCTSSVWLQVLPFIDNRQLGAFLASSEFLVLLDAIVCYSITSCKPLHCVIWWFYWFKRIL